MSYTIAPSEDRQYIILRVVGEINRKLAMQQNREAHALGRDLGINRYLVDLTGARNTDSTLDQYEFAHQDMPQTEDIDYYAKVAVVVAPDDHSHDFIETVARNAGLNVRIFTEMDAAKAYLLRYKKPPNPKAD